jgi:hypothetical protein
MLDDNPSFYVASAAETRCAAVAAWVFSSFSVLFLVALSQSKLAADEPDAALRINEAQIIGTHNSYHVAPDAVAEGLIRVVAPQEADANA